MARRILIVEDNQNLVVNLFGFLESRSYSLDDELRQVIVGSGAEACDFVFETLQLLPRTDGGTTARLSFKSAWAHDSALLTCQPKQSSQASLVAHR